MKLFVIIAILISTLTGLSYLIADAEAKIWYIYVDEIPKHWEPKFNNVINDATKFWEERVPDTKFYQVSFPEQSEFVIQWASQYIGTKLGYYTPSSINDYGRPYIAITLGYMDKESTKWQDRKFNLVDSDYASEITKHEIGHAIGFLHSQDPNDIMYSKIYDYERWLKNKNNLTKINENIVITQTDWEKESIKYQKWTGYKLTALKSGINFAEESLSEAYSDNPQRQVSVNNAWTALWWAKKFFDESELMQKEGYQLISEAKVEEAFYKYQNSFNHAEKIMPYLFEITIYLNESKYQN